MNKPARHKANHLSRTALNPWRRMSGMLVAVLVVPTVFAGGPAVLNAGQTGVALAVDTPNQQIVGPGKVQLTLTRDGRWLGFSTNWNNGRNLFTVGGLLAYASGPDGALVEVANTTKDGTRVSENASKIRRSCEGTRGGFRAPSPNPDDDNDGRVDEDRLDGVDNDGDGAIDEDFAAIGDEMVTTCFFTPTLGGTGAQLAFHQESYAWSLPHIDGTVMMGLAIKNIGAGTLEDVHLGAFLEKEGPFYFSNWTVTLPNATNSNASAVVCEDLYGTSVGLIVFPDPENRALDQRWMSGFVEGAKSADAVLLERLTAYQASIVRSPLDESEDLASSSDASVLKTEEKRVDDKSLVYAVSPSLGTLAPGEEVYIHIALFAVPEKTEVEVSAINAFKTYAGDGINRYLPPPVSMTPRVLWGSYRPMAKAPSGTPQVVVDIEALGDDPVAPDDISYFSGIDPSAVDRVETQPGVEQLVLQGETLGRRARKGERIVLKGRLEDGEFFEAILRPEESAGGTDVAVQEEALFWKTSGRLDADLLRSSPNPFRDATTIYYEIPSLIEQEDGSSIRTTEPLVISVKIYNVVGRLVSVLVDEEILSPGVYTTDWSAVDDNGTAVASGVYYIRLQIAKKYLTQRLILLK